MYVYLLQSLTSPTQRYIGRTEDLERRLEEHNRGAVGHTKKCRPWKIVVAVFLENPRKAAAFERYLKSGSGRSFAGLHLW